MADDAPVRRRKAEQSQPTESQDEKPKQDAPAKSKKKTTKDRLDDDEQYSTANLCLDIFRVVTFILLASTGLSYLVTTGESFSWNLPTKYFTPDWWMKQFRGPLYLTPAQLALHDGTDPTKPIYLAINGTIYDVSANSRTYGPGGSYHYFAGCDAARAFVTGCFAEDRTADMRGVEEMFLPIDDPAVDLYWSKEELAEMKKREREEAERKVREGLEHWVKFFGESPKYDFVGYVKREEGWPGTEPRRGLCEAAGKGRKRREVPKDKRGK